MSLNTRPTTGKDNSGKLFDAIMQARGLKSDAALARLLDLGAPVVSKIRHGRLTIGAATILRVHEAVGMPVKEIRALIGEGA